MLAPPAAFPPILLRRRHRLPVVAPNTTARWRRNRFVVATFAACALDGRRRVLFGRRRLQTGVEGLVRIPSFASVGRVVFNRLAGLGAFSRTVQIVNFGQIVVGHVERILGRRRRPGQRRCSALLFRLSCRVLAHFGPRRFLQRPAMAERSAGRWRMVERLALPDDGSVAAAMLAVRLLVAVQK